MDKENQEDILQVLFQPDSNPASAETSHNSVYKNQVLCNTEKAKQIFESTKTQAKSGEWFLQRGPRITASKAHRIAHSKTDKTCINYFKEKMFTCAAVEYGKEMESKALDKYKFVTSSTVFQSGLVVSVTEPWLCATPDAISKFGEEFVCVEIKCPYSCAFTDSIRVPYLAAGKLNKKHSYYTQCQIQMYCCNLKKCHFFVYSDQDFVLLVIPRDEKFIKQTIQTLKKKYFDVLLKTVEQPTCVDVSSADTTMTPRN